MRGLARRVAACLAGLCLASGAQAAPDGPLRLSYELYAGGLNAMDAVTVLELSDERYDVKLQARTAGVTGRVFPFLMEARSQGTRGGDIFAPSEYATANRSGERKVRWVRMTYENGAPEITAEPPRDGDRGSVPEDARRGTLDPVSAVYSLLVTSVGQCEGTAQVFDGRRRYDVTAHDRGMGEVWPSRYNIYDGPARICDLTLEQVAGFGDRFEESDRFPDTVRVYLAEIVPGVPALPVRIESETLVGAVRAHLTGLSRGESAALSEIELLP